MNLGLLIMMSLTP